MGEAGLCIKKAAFADRTEREMGERLRGTDPAISMPKGETIS